MRGPIPAATLSQEKKEGGFIGVRAEVFPCSARVTDGALPVWAGGPSGDIGMLFRAARSAYCACRLRISLAMSATL